MFRRHSQAINDIIPSAVSRLRLRINGFLGIFTHANTADRTYTLPDNSGTVALTADPVDVLQVDSLRRRSLFDRGVLDMSLALLNKLGLKYGGTHTDLSSVGPGALWQTSSGADVSSVEPVIIRVKNVSGATANANEAGLISYDSTNGYSYNTTTTANQNGQWCVVVVGGANNADIWVARRGQVTVKLNANCSIGNFLATSTTAGQASVLTTARAEIFAVALSANSGGAGGTCTALLLTGNQFIPAVSSNEVWQNAGRSATAFVATINGAPSTTSVVHNAPSSGNGNVLNPAVSTNIARARLWNTTRNTYRRITAYNSGTSTITTEATTDSWANGDTITIESQTTFSGATEKCIEMDLSQSTEIPAEARMIRLTTTVYDTGAAASIFYTLHPYDTFSTAKQQLCRGIASYSLAFSRDVGLIGRVFCYRGQATGTGTAVDDVRLGGYWVPAP